MLKKLILVSLLFFAQNSFATYLCSGYLVSPDGYIVTAGHCAGNTLTVIYFDKDKKPRSETATIAALDKDRDEMVLKIPVDGVNYLVFNDFDVTPGEGIMYIGFPNPNIYGYNVKHFSGTYLRPEEDKLLMYVFSAGGASGSPIIDSNGYVVGTLVAGYEIAGGYSLLTLAVKESTIKQFALENHIPLSYVVALGSAINKKQSDELFESKKTAIVFLFIN